MPNIADDDFASRQADADRPSKSQRKREATALQRLGEQLVELKPAQLDKLPLSEDLREAILFAQGLHQRGARKRQRQLIGKLMRRAEAEPLQAALAALTTADPVARRHRQQLEQRCDALIAGDTAVLTAFLDEYPGTDAQQLRQLIRNAARALAQDKQPAVARNILLRYLQAVTTASAPATVEEI